MSYNLYFLPSNRKPELIKKFNTYLERNFIKAIYEDAEKRNSKFEIYYVRSWGNVEDKRGKTYDIGSHTEFYKVYKEES